jgi:uncharacterized protein (TIGR02145 family)
MTGSFVDKRDGQSYKTITIGKQTWMAENLNYIPHDSITTEFSGSWCYDNDPKNCEQYGRLYSGEVAKKVCPDGWHLPSLDEFLEIVEHYEGESITIERDTWPKNSKDAGILLKKGGIGFDALYAGHRPFLRSLQSETDIFEGINKYTEFWTSYSAPGDQVSVYLTPENQKLRSIYNDYDLLNNAYSVRCIKD